MPVPVPSASSGTTNIELNTTSETIVDRSTISNEDNIDVKYSVNGRYGFPVSKLAPAKDKTKNASARIQTLPEVGLLEGSASDTEGTSDLGKLNFNLCHILMLT